MNQSERGRERGSTRTSSIPGVRWWCRGGEARSGADESTAAIVGLEGRWRRLGASGADSFREKPRGDEAKLPARLAGRGAPGRACTAAGQPDGVVREKRRGGEMGKKKRRGTQL